MLTQYRPQSRAEARQSLKILVSPSSFFQEEAPQVSREFLLAIALEWLSVQNPLEELPRNPAIVGVPLVSYQGGQWYIEGMIRLDSRLPKFQGFLIPVEFYINAQQDIYACCMGA